MLGEGVVVVLFLQHLEAGLLVLLLLLQNLFGDALLLQFLLVVPADLLVDLVLETVIEEVLVLVIHHVYETHGLVVVAGVAQHREVLVEVLEAGGHLTLHGDVILLLLFDQLLA